MGIDGCSCSLLFSLVSFGCMTFLCRMYLNECALFVQKENMYIKRMRWTKTKGRNGMWINGDAV